jgi:hypothetical protein
VAARCRRRGQFEILCRAFFAQFFASESVTSTMQMQRSMAGPLAFLLVPALFMPLQMVSTFEAAAIRFPQLLEPLTRLMATVFIMYAMVAVGVIAGVMWDSLSFDRRDAMVLGPLPLRTSTVITAKIAAMAMLLLVVALSISLMTGVPFAMVAGNHKSAAGVVRHFVAHMAATLTAATFVYCLVVTLRALVGGLSGRHVALATLLRFLLFSGLLCFIVFAPTALNVTPGGRRRPTTLQMQTIPGWSPTNWFLGLHEWIRGSPGAEWDGGARRAIGFTLAVTIAAVATTIAGYGRQLQRALAPSADAGVRGGARLQRAIARLILGRDQLARATADFVLATIVRNGSQQAPIAINAAVGLMLIVGALLRATSDAAPMIRPRTAVLWIPLVLVYWIGIGLRAAFFVPSDLPASWTFRFNAPLRASAFWAGTRAAAIGFMVPLALVADALLVPLLGFHAAAWHAAVVLAVAVAIAEAAALTVDFVPFTRPYEPGHARLKTRWPLYAIGLYVCAFVPARAALYAAGDPAAIMRIAETALAVAAALEIAGWWRSRRWQVDPAEEFGDESQIAVLDIGLVVPGALQQ